MYICQFDVQNCTSNQQEDTLLQRKISNYVQVFNFVQSIHTKSQYLVQYALAFNTTSILCFMLLYDVLQSSLFKLG
jgi:hypothetical protein